MLNLLGYVVAKVGQKIFLNASYSFSGRKFEHALKHGSKLGLSVVTLGWFVDSARRNGKKLFPVFLEADVDF